ncbi:AAA family ATPase [Marinobacter oulmenensis]|uniref:AAA family ATPase n=1 Tax=Marinobacter oulmenensis TaxID=643747 RepID=UPI00161A83C8
MHSYSVVFPLPPWKDIYETDSERDQTFAESVEVFEGMKGWYSQWGYKTLEVPRCNIDARIAFILRHIND